MLCGEISGLILIGITVAFARREALGAVFLPPVSPEAINAFYPIALSANFGTLINLGVGIAALSLPGYNMQFTKK